MKLNLKRITSINWKIFFSKIGEDDLLEMSASLSFYTALFSAGAIFGDLRHSLNRIFDVSPKEVADKEKNSFFLGAWGFLKEKLFNMGMVLTFGISLLIFWFLFSAIYFFLPQTGVQRSVAVISGFITAVLFSIGKGLIGLYLGQSAAASLYGAAGSLIVLLMCVYYSSAVIYFSAELAHEINRKDSHASDSKKSS